MDLQPGDQIRDVFSRTTAIHADGYEDGVRRVSGTASYKITGIANGTYDFQCSYNYDGIQSGENHGQIRDGGRTQCYEGKCAAATDASGAVVNPLLWGEMPANAQAGTQWQMDIVNACELGPPGKQTVTVVSVDPQNSVVILKREGSGSGATDHGHKRVTLTKDGKTYSFDSKAENTHWVGSTIIRKGIIVSDELMTERVLMLSSEQARLVAHERQYILLGLMPN